MNNGFCHTSNVLPIWVCKSTYIHMCTYVTIYIYIIIHRLQYINIIWCRTIYYTHLQASLTLKGSVGGVAAVHFLTMPKPFFHSVPIGLYVCLLSENPKDNNEIAEFVVVAILISSIQRIPAEIGMSQKRGNVTDKLNKGPTIPNSKHTNLQSSNRTIKQATSQPA